MKKVAVQLSEPRQIDGKLRRPQEGSIQVSAEEAAAIEQAKAGKIVNQQKSKAAEKGE